MIEHQAQVGDVVVEIVGRDTAAQIGLTANERAATIKCEAISSVGEHLVASGLGTMVPEQGWGLVAAADTGCTLEAAGPLSVRFEVVNPGSATWFIHVRVVFVPDSTVYP